MPRKPVTRIIHCQPDAILFKPQGIPVRQLEEIVLGLDENEAIRLADLEGHTQEEISKWMHISRATVGRILEKGRRKLADVITNGKALRIEGGPIRNHSDLCKELDDLHDCEGCKKQIKGKD